MLTLKMFSTSMIICFGIALVINGQRADSDKKGNAVTSPRPNNQVRYKVVADTDKAEDDDDPRIMPELTITPTEVLLLEEQTIDIVVHYNLSDIETFGFDLLVKAEVEKSRFQSATIRGPTIQLLKQRQHLMRANESQIVYSLYAAEMGYTRVFFYTKLNVTNSAEKESEIQGIAPLNGTVRLSVKNSRKNEWVKNSKVLKVAVARKPRAIDTIWTIVIISVVVVANISMGCKTDLAVVKDVLKKPIGPGVGFFSQYCFMPLIAFAIAKIAEFENIEALGFFAMGCAPGGGASNIYSYLMKGDVSLSITMTLISTIASLGMIPLWLFTLGQQFMKEKGQIIVIPFQNIIFSLLSIVIPVVIGVVIRYKRPSLAKKIGKCIKPVMIIILIIIFTFGIYANLYIFKRLTPKLLLAGMWLPWIGFVLGGLMAFIFRLPLYRIRTIAIETGIQNIGVPLLIMRLSLAQPAGDLASVASIAAGIFTPLPLWVGVAYFIIKDKCCKKKVQLEKEMDNKVTNGDDILDTQGEIKVTSRMIKNGGMIDDKSDNKENSVKKLNDDLEGKLLHTEPSAVP